jgi:hypothetical protein
MGNIQNAYRILTGNHDEKSLLGKPRLRKDNNIKIDIQ